jgi:fructose-1-phosphate kinase PfkB-like protein
VIDRATGIATELVEDSKPAGQQGWIALQSKLQELLPRAAVWIFSGTLAPDAEKDFYARWLPFARERGARAIVDVSGEPLRLAMRHPNAILKMNRDELALTLGRDLRDERTLSRAMLEYTPREGLLIVTLGAAGAIACDGHRVWRGTSPRIHPVSAVGSGDSFAAGLAVALGKGESLAEALKLAIACGAANALTPLAGHVDRATVERLRSEVKVTQEEPPSSPSPSGRGQG